jgi:hypothetical protein
MNLDTRIARLEALYSEDDGPSLEQRLREAQAEAQERHVQGLPAPEAIDLDHP